MASAVEDDVGVVAAMLEEARRSAERAGDYMQALECKRRLEELEALELRRLEDVARAEALRERVSVDAQHVAELEQLNARWEEWLAQHDAQAQADEDELVRRHVQEINVLRARFNLPEAARELERTTGRTSARFKASAELLKLRTREAALVQAQEYERATRTKAHADDLEAQERERWLEQHSHAQHHAETQLLARQRVQLSSLRTRGAAARSEAERAQAAERAKLSKRHDAALAALDTRHWRAGMPRPAGWAGAQAEPGRGRAKGSTRRARHAAAQRQSFIATRPDVLVSPGPRHGGPVPPLRHDQRQLAHHRRWGAAAP